MKIEMLSVEFKNFYSFGNKWQKIELLNGLNLITGKNNNTQKSNGAGKCVRGNTLVNIKIGNKEQIKYKIFDLYKNFSKIKDDIFVETRYGWKKILNCKITAYNSEIVRITTNSGKSIETSPDHKMFFNTWKFAKEFEMNDFILTKDGIEKIKNKMYLDFKEDLYDIEVDDVHEYYANDFVSHNSNFFEAIIFGLFGKTTKDVNKPKIVNWKNEKNCEVKVELKKNDDIYVIHRGLKPNFLRVLKNEKEIEQLSHNIEFQDEIEKYILEMDYDTFISLIYYNPSRSQSIFDSAKGQKRSFIEKLFGLEIYSELIKKCNEKSNSINGKIADIKRDIEFNKKSVESLKEQNAELKEMMSNFIDYSDEILSIEKKIDGWNDNKKAKKLRENELIEKRNKVIDFIKKNSIELTEIDKKIFNIEDKIKKNQLKSNNIKFDKNEYEALLNNKANIQSEFINIDEVKNNISKSNSKLISVQKEIREIENNISELKGRLHSIPDIILSSNKCPICESEIDPENLKSHINEKKNSLLFSINENIEKINKLKKNEEIIKQSLIEEEKNEQKYYKLKEEMSHINEKLIEFEIKKNEFENFLLEEKEIEEQKLELNELKNEYTSLEKNNKKYIKMEEILNNQFNELKMIEIEQLDLKNKINIIKEQQKKQEEQRQNFLSLIKTNNEKINNLKYEITKNEQENTKLKDLLDYLEFIKKICKDENVKQYAISAIVPFLNSKANEYLSEAGFDFYLKLDNWLNVEIKGPGIRDANFGNLSSGQQKTTNLAMIFSFLDICKIQLNTFPDILLLDEILDGAIDSLTISQISNIITKKQRKDNSKIFIVTHRKEIGEIQFDNFYKVEMTDRLFNHNKRKLKGVLMDFIILSLIITIITIFIVIIKECHKK